MYRISNSFFDKESLQYGIVSLELLVILMSSSIVYSQVTSNNVNLLSFFYLSYRSKTLWIGDVWGYCQDGKEFALVGVTDGGVSIIDVTNPRSPVEVSWIPIPPGGDLLYHVRPSNKGYAYAVMRPGPLQIIDIRDPYNAHEIAQYSTNFTGCYGLFIYEDRDWLILHDTKGSPPEVSLIILDISNPVNPVELGTYSSQFHHVYVRNDTLYGFRLNDEAEVVDISDPARPVRIKIWSTGDEMTHSGWLSDNTHVLTTDHEHIGGGIHFWDLSSLPGEPVLLGTYYTDTNFQGDVSAHHSRYYFNLVYISYWQDGLRILDVSDPTTPQEVGVYDVVVPNKVGSHYYGAWGVYPYLPSRNILLSHSRNPGGLFVLDYVNDGPGLFYDEIDTIYASNVISDSFTVINGQNIIAESSYVYYRTDTQPTWKRVNVLSTQMDSVFTFQLPVDADANHLEYYIEAQDSNGNKTRAPGLAPYLDYYETVISHDTPLEVSLIYFQAIAHENTIHIEWKTASEIENAGFNLFRSENGEKYERISSYTENPDLVGLGNSSIGKTYSFTDEEVSHNETYWYKLISVSYNGQIEEFGPISVSLNGEEKREFELYPNYPNPFNENTQIKYVLPAKTITGTVKAFIFDLNGRKLKRLYEGRYRPGVHKLFWGGTDDSGRKVSSGIYLLKLETPLGIKVIKLLLIR
ncbi:MAG: choice-of-anchor B family protein [Methanobacteriota archaeon]|nr:MAG: choice-of-anchor B family protein [Euryarchaeota archaeon]